ncbi:MAG: UDP-N-acetylmuramoyl-tripeptide--D-alanyl-D-alanine ligase [Clostridia bacterium]|nr:UDP-N-acetylmuramoyl-tripeptide--D-alanyl-D-alanine ligase [Clostridia bacterium]
MVSVKLSEIVNATKGEVLSGNANIEITDIVTDSRKITKDCLFVPLVGERFDGHDFIEKAIALGAVATFTSKNIKCDDKSVTVIRVNDTLAALRQTAQYYRSLFDINVVGLTGSVGKTTTKEMVAQVLSQKMNTLKTEGNFNNEIGLPLTVFRLDNSHECAVLEMGMSGFGEIQRLSSVAKPDLAMITNIGMSHIELLGSQENIYKAKSEIFNNVKKGGTVIINGDDPILKKHKDEIEHKTYTVGKNAGCDALATDIKVSAESVSFKFSGFGKSFDVKLNIPGEHNVYNALFAITTGIHFGVSDNDIIRALAEFRPANMRMDTISHNGYTIINDCYNAAPDSMNAALKVLGAYSGKKIAVLGDIACLGEYSYEAHKGVGASVVLNKIDELLTVGAQAKFIAQGAFESGMDSSKIHSYDTAEELNSRLSSVLEKGCYVLVKASRVMELEKVTEFMINSL